MANPMGGDVTVKWDKPAMVKVAGKVSKPAVEKAGRITQNRAKANIAASGRYKTGRMLEQVLVRPVEVNARGEASCIVVSDVPYSAFQEYGTSRGIKPAYFMRNALKSLGLRDFLL